MTDEYITTLTQGEPSVEDERAKSAKTITTVVYALQAASFFLVITFLIAIIINYVKQGDVKGTWLESHFRWQIRTFWFYCLWIVVAIAIIVSAFDHSTTGIVFIGTLMIVANSIWVIYRIVKGWLYLMDNKNIK